MADNIINLSLDRINVESTSTSIVREYLARKGFKETLKKLDEECPRDEKSLNSRTKILDYLKINKLHDANKKLKEPYTAVLEVILSYLVVNDILIKNNSINIKSIQVKEKQVLFESQNMGNDQSNDLRIDDAEDGELTDGTEKRFKNQEKESDFNKKRVPLKKPALNVENEKKSMKKEVITEKKIENDFFRNEDINKKQLTNDLFGEQTKEISINTDKNDDLDDFDRLLKEKAKKMQVKSKNDETQIEKEIIKKEDNFNEKLFKKENKTSIEDNTNAPLLLPKKLNNTTTNNNTAITNNNNNNNNNNINPNNLNTINAIKKDYQTIPIDYQKAVALKTLIFGNPNIVFNDEWKYQSFMFCDFVKLKYGLLQKKGGPCGVLASVQAYIIIELLYSNESSVTVASFDVNKRERSKILAIAIAKLLWKCGQEHNEAFVCVPTNKAHFAPVGKYRSDGITETLNLLQFNNYKTIEEYLIKNISIFENEENFGVCLLLYSAIFSRTIQSIQSDMDEPTNKLMGQHFYCTQDMVNLLIHGKAYSNVFNDTVYLDTMKLRGPDKRNDIGLLSLFEHYKSCEVGSYYKTPKYPVWIICSESHFSVMFSLKKEILSDWKAEHKFDLYYYDGLARQDEQIKLTIDCSNHVTMFSRPKPKSDKKVDLVPPLELVIQTKWKDANIDWNGYEPIL